MDHIIWDIAISTSHYCKWCIFTDLGGNGVQMSITTSSLPPKKRHAWDRSCVHFATLGRSTCAMDHMLWEIITFTSHYCKWCVFTYLGGNGVQTAGATKFFFQRKKCLGQQIDSPCDFGEGYRYHGPHNVFHQKD